MDGSLLFSDIPNSRTVCWRESPEGFSVSTYRTPSGNANGLTLDGEGRLISCEHSARRVSRQEADGSYSSLADSYQGKKLNSPNDVVVRSDGIISISPTRRTASKTWALNRTWTSAACT